MLEVIKLVNLDEDQIRTALIEFVENHSPEQVSGIVFVYEEVDLEKGDLSARVNLKETNDPGEGNRKKNTKT
jgi:hypothetical protein